MGQGCIDAPSWSAYMFNWLEDHFPGQVTGRIGGVGGTMSSYMGACHNMHISKDADIIFVEYTVNETPIVDPPFGNDLRKGFERLLRRLLAYPKRPAIILMHAFMWFRPMPDGSVNPTYYNSAEHELSLFGTYYAIPQLSLKAAVYQNFLNDVPGFSVTDQRHRREDLRDHLFYHDPHHPSGRTGARVMAELGIHLLIKAMVSVKRRRLAEYERAAVVAPLPQPMIPNNYESKGDKCFIGNHFTDVVVEKEGFEWINEARVQDGRPKWGMVSTTVGSKLLLKVDTRGTDWGLQASAGTPAGAPKQQQQVLVELAFLRSYERMGTASVACTAGCTCTPTKLDGHYETRASQLYLHRFFVGQHEACVITITVLPETNSGQHKVKVSGIVVSEQAGEQVEGINNSDAVEYVHDISMRAKDGVYDVSNHVR